jgi:hypothetical protein
VLTPLIFSSGAEMTTALLIIDVQEGLFTPPPADIVF